MAFSKNKLHVALIGFGYWGENLLRNMNENVRISDISICDTDITRCEKAQNLYPRINTFHSADRMFLDKSIDAVIIATPPADHFDLALKALENNKHVLVEKPITSSTNHLHQLVALAEAKNKVLMVDHTFLYNPAIQYIKMILEGNTLGNINYIDSTRINLGAYQQDVNVIWDLACHDLSIVEYLIDERPIKLRAIVRDGSTPTKEDIAYIFLQYKSGLLIQINCSWASPVKIRQMIIGAENKMIIYDDIEPSQKIKIYDYEKVPSSKKSKNETLIDYRLGDIHMPKLSNNEPLKSLLNDFIHCIHTGDIPISNTQRALNVICLLEKVEESIFKNGELIDLL